MDFNVHEGFFCSLIRALGIYDQKGRLWILAEIKIMLFTRKIFFFRFAKKNDQLLYGLLGQTSSFLPGTI